MGISTCIPCKEEMVQPRLSGGRQRQIAIENAAQITIDAKELNTTEGIFSPIDTKSQIKNNLSTRGASNNLNSNICISNNIPIDSKYSNNPSYSKSAVEIQKIWRGKKQRDDFKDQIELMNNIIILDSTSLRNKSIEQYLSENEGEKLYQKLKQNNQIAEHEFEKKKPSKYLIEVPLSFIDTNSDDLYEGTITLDKVRSGYGVLYSQGSKYEGNWENNKLNGYSRIFLSAGDFFEGNIKNGIASGYGKFIHDDGNIYEGNWVNDKPEGKGKEIYNDGSLFEGQFSDGEKVEGKLSWKDGSYYKGKIKDNLFEGEGLFHWNEGREYNGTWKKGKMDGYGTMTYKNGSVYEGGFKNGKRSGQGKYVWNENKIYEGEWSDGKQNGFGVYTRNGKTIQGTWSGGRLLNETKGAISANISQTDASGLNFLTNRLGDKKVGENVVEEGLKGGANPKPPKKKEKKKKKEKE